MIFIRTSSCSQGCPHFIIYQYSSCILYISLGNVLKWASPCNTRPYFHLDVDYPSDSEEGDLEYNMDEEVNDDFL